jgi:hypothetical protein
MLSCPVAVVAPDTLPLMFEIVTPVGTTTTDPPATTIEPPNTFAFGVPRAVTSAVNRPVTSLSIAASPAPNNG